MRRAFFFAMMLSVSSCAFGCKCPDYSLSEDLEHASVVFVGATNSNPPSEQHEVSGATISFVVSRSLKGAPPVGSSVTIDPFFGTDCTAHFISGAQLLVFAYAQAAAPPIANACSVRAAEAFSVGGKSYQPSAEVIQFLKSVPN